MRDAIRIDAIEGRILWQLKTWLPPQAEGTRAILERHQLPLRVGQTSDTSGRRVLGIGPQEWLLVSDAPIESAQLPPEFAALDVSDGLITLSMQDNDSTRDLLSKGCGLDLHPRLFGVGQCARTRFAQIPLLLSCLDNPRRFELYATRSYKQYLRDWLLDAAGHS
jgi:sarcosine oxidase subunit gamma